MFNLRRKAKPTQEADRPEWERLSHWMAIYRPEGFSFAVFKLQPDGSWIYNQPDNPAHEGVKGDHIEPLMAEAELDWAAHRQVLRQADMDLARYNGRWFLPGL